MKYVGENTYKLLESIYLEIRQHNWSIYKNLVTIIYTHVIVSIKKVLVENQHN